MPVNDGFVNSDANNVTITAVSSTSAVVSVLDQAIAVVNGFPASAFKNANMRNALTNKINEVLALIDRHQYGDAIAKLQNDVLQKTDGCAMTGAPDKNDWILDCATHGQLYPLLVQAIQMLRGM